MLALADQNILADKVDIMLKVGLGALGKVSSVSFETVFCSKKDYRKTSLWLDILVLHCNGLQAVQRK